MRSSLEMGGGDRPPPVTSSPGQALGEAALGRRVSANKSLMKSCGTVAVSAPVPSREMNGDIQGSVTESQRDNPLALTSDPAESCVAYSMERVVAEYIRRSGPESMRGAPRRLGRWHRNAFPPGVLPPRRSRRTPRACESFTVVTRWQESNLRRFRGKLLT